MTSPYDKALLAIDAAHAQDPRQHTTADGSSMPYELHYAQKMTHYLSLRDPDASQALRLAIRAQHFRRWEVPRDSYPMTKAGYYSWRTYLKKRQAELVEEICTASGIDKEEAEKVGSLVRKEDLKTDEETMVLEDVACLVFLDDQFEGFKEGYDEEKVVNIVKKTWIKMTDKGHELALQIPMSDDSKIIIGKALA